MLCNRRKHTYVSAITFVSRSKNWFSYWFSGNQHIIYILFVVIICLCWKKNSRQLSLYFDCFGNNKLKTPSMIKMKLAQFISPPYWHYLYPLPATTFFSPPKKSQVCQIRFLRRLRCYCFVFPVHTWQSLYSYSI